MPDGPAPYTVEMEQQMHVGGIPGKIKVNKRPFAVVTSRLLVSAATCALGTAPILYSHASLAQTVQSRDADAAAARQFNISSQPLNRALTQFGRQSGLQVAFPAEVPSALQSRAVSGKLTPQQALGQLLQGTGVSYRIDQGTAFVSGGVAAANGGQGEAVAEDGSLVLETINITGQRDGYDGSFTPDTPFETPGAVSHISRDQIDRIAPTSPGDMFVNTPGVLNGGNRVGNSLNPNIRGLQGMGRVNTTVDGALNSSTSYRGYAGTRDETYVDPDMIGGIDITKGPSDGVGGGAIGGSIAMRTLNAGDIVRDGDNWGVRFKGGLGGNTIGPLDRDPIGPSVRRDADRPSFLNNDSWSGSVAGAVLQDNFEGVVAITKRKEGNYFAGRNNPANGFIYGDAFLDPPGRNAVIRPGGEVYNTSQDTESVLAKGKFKWGDGQSFELGYMLYDSLAGEEDEALINVPRNIGQRMLSRTRVDTYTARYRNQPSDDPLINLRANLWHTNLDHERDRGAGRGLRNYTMATTGGDIANTSEFETSYGTLKFDVGAEFRHEHAEAPAQIVDIRQESRGPNGFRTLASGFAKTTYEPTDWLELSAGGRFDYYTAEGEGIASVYPDRSQSRFSPNFGAVIKPFDGVQLFAQYKEGFRPPSLREMYWQMYTLQVNPDLKGEVSKNWEFGFNLLNEDVLTAGDKLGFKASYFRNRYDDFIMVDEIPDWTGPGLGGAQHFTNIDRANYQGIELSGTYDSGWFFAEGAFTKYLEAEYCKAEIGCFMPGLNETLANVTPPTYVPPEWSGSVTAGVRLFDEALTLGGRATFASTRIGSRWAADSNAGGNLIGFKYTWPEFVVFDVFGSYKFSEDTMLNFSIENITDQYYYGPLATTGMPSPGRTARISFTHRIGGAGFVNIPEIGQLGRASFGAPGDDWTGLYVGGHLGFATGDVSGTASTFTGGGMTSSEAADYSDTGRIGGAQIGYNHQFDNRWVVGFEGDFSLLNQKSGIGRTFSTEAGYAGQLASETEYELDWTASLRGRLGYSFGRLMVYGTGGLSFLQQSGTRTQYRANAAGSGTEKYFAESDSSTSLGWTLGAGVEYAIANNWSIKGEYSYSSFGSSNLAFDQARGGVTRPSSQVICIRYRRGVCIRESTVLVPGSSDTVQGLKASNDADVHLFKVGLNYRF